MTASAESSDRTARVVVRRLPGFGPATPTVPSPRQPVDAEAPNTGHEPAPSPDPPAPGSPDAAASPGTAEVEPAYVRLVLRMVLEVLHRRRPTAHLAGILGVRARRYVASMSGRVGAHPPAGRVGGKPVCGRLGGGLHAVRICSPAEGIAEVGAVWADRNRYRALAARFERHQPGPNGPPRWYCTEIRLG